MPCIEPQKAAFSPACKVSRWNISRLCSEVYHNLPQSSSGATGKQSFAKSPMFGRV